MAEEESTQIQRNQMRGRRLKPRSKVWEHFTRHTGDDGKDTVKCKRCGKVYAYYGTTNLWEHLKEGCGGQESADAGTLEQPPQPVPSQAQDDEAMQQQLSGPGESSGCEPHQFMPLEEAPRLLPKEAAAAAQKEGAAVQQQHLCPPSGSGASVDRDPRLDQDEAMQDTEEANNAKAEGCGGQESADAATSEQPPQPQPSLAQDDEAMQQLPRLPPSCAPSPNLQEEACKHLARMIALRGYDASVLEDDCFRSFVTSLNPEFEVPSRVAIAEMCGGIFDEARRGLWDRLRRAPGKVSVAVGRAKTMEEQVLYVACHFIDDGWNLQNLLLHASVTTDPYDDNDGLILGVDTSTYDIGFFFNQVISDLRIDDRLFLVTCETTDKEDIHLALMLGLINPNRKEKLFSTYVDNVLHSIARCLLPDADFTEGVFSDMWRLNLTRQGRLELLAELDLHYGWAYDEHWYACYCSLEVLCKKGFPIQHTDDVKLLCKLWEKIYRAIQNFSFSIGPTANLCLAELFKLRDVLQSELARFSSGDHGDDYGVFEDDKDVTHVLREACDTLDKAIEDFYLAWSLPLALDPRHKLEFISFNFKRAYGSEAAKEYVSKVRIMITKLYADYVEEYYGTTDGAHHSDGAGAMDITTSADYPLGQAWNEHCRSQQGMTELDRYLKDPLAPQAEDFDILNWWKAHSSEYPMVARMARDALAMPTCCKLSSDQMAQVRSILRSYSEEPYRIRGFRN